MPDNPLTAAPSTDSTDRDIQPSPAPPDHHNAASSSPFSNYPNDGGRTYPRRSGRTDPCRRDPRRGGRRG
ncbi:hypothetical protein DEO72_LG11g687 [Vigna unguiculata]|nr:hypothetical protein DEO72_LG11g687 [Vigna unguiculata]